MFIIFHFLYFALYILSFSEEELDIDGKKKEFKKDENNNTVATNAEREREKNWSSDTLEANILHEMHTYRQMVMSLYLVNSLAMPWKHNDIVLK